MADHFHDIGDLVGCNDASTLRFGTNLCWQPIFVGLEYSSLMQTDSGRMYVHIEKDCVGVIDACWETECWRQRQRCIEEDIVQSTMSFPKSTIEIVIIVCFRGSMEVCLGYDQREST